MHVGGGEKASEWDRRGFVSYFSQRCVFSSGPVLVLLSLAENKYSPFFISGNSGPKWEGYPLSILEEPSKCRCPWNVNCLIWLITLAAWSLTSLGKPFPRFRPLADWNGPSDAKRKSPCRLLCGTQKQLCKVVFNLICTVAPRTEGGSIWDSYLFSSIQYLSVLFIFFLSFPSLFWLYFDFVLNYMLH